MTKLATVAAFGFGDFNPPTLLPVYRELGCRTCQFYRNTDNPPELSDARRIAEDAGLPIDSVHGVFGFEHDPSSPDESIRQKAIETYRVEGDAALQLGGPMVVVHPSPMAKSNEDTSESARATRVDPMKRSMEELAAIGDETGVTYLIENLLDNYLFGSNAAQLAELIRDLNHPRVRMCFDTGHAHMTAGMNECMEPCSDAIEYLHVNDNDAKSDSHLMPGDGTIDWDASVVLFENLPGARVPSMLEIFYLEPKLKQMVADGLGDRLAKWLSVADR